MATATATINSNAISSYHRWNHTTTTYLLLSPAAYDSAPTPTTLAAKLLAFKKPSSSSSSFSPIKCSSSSSSSNSQPAGGGGGGGGFKGLLSGIVDESVEQLLNKEENRGLLDGLEKATQRVEMAKRELAEIEKQEIEAKRLRDYINHLESTTSEIEECQKEILEARAMVEEAERALAVTDDVSKDEERIESIKAATISALVGTLVWLPISLTTSSSSSELILPLGVTFLSCALFGVTFRYAVRRDLDDFHLKTGPSAAFGVVKGLATLDGGPPLQLEVGSLLSHAISGAVYVSENLLVFLFAAIALDFCYKSRVLSPYPILPRSEAPKNDNLLE